MSKLLHPLGRLLAKLQRRFQTSRPGSVMILVITLLVLMALIGTAYISTARTDRYTVYQHEVNTQAEVLMDSVKQAVMGKVSNVSYLSSAGQRWDDVQSDNWLTSRVPTTLQEAVPDWNGVALSYNLGDWVKYPALSTTFYVCSQAIGASAFATPPGPATAPDADTAHWVKVPASINPNAICWRAISAPPVSGVPGASLAVAGVAQSAVVGTFDATSFRTIVFPTFVNVAGKSYPAFQIFDPATLTFPTVMAASASGDGIADSFLFPVYGYSLSGVPANVGDLNGVTYLAAVRVIDDNSAININTANSTFFDFDGSGGVVNNDAIFPSNIGLLELLAGINLTSPTPTASDTDVTTFGPTPPGPRLDLGGLFESLNLNFYRHTGLNPRITVPTYPGVTAAYQSSRPSGILGASPTTTYPISDAGAQRTEFLYRTEADALFMGLGRRIDFPGVASNVRFGAFSWADNAVLKYRFDLMNPASINNLSLPDQLLANSLVYDPYQNRLYPENPFPANSTAPLSVIGGPPGDPNYPGLWYGPNYFYGDATTYLGTTPSLRPAFNRRPLLVARNPTSNLMPISQALTLPPPAPPQPAFDWQSFAAFWPDVAVKMGVAVQNTSGPPFAVYPLSAPWPDPRAQSSPTFSATPSFAIPRVSLNTADATTNIPIAWNSGGGAIDPAHPFRGPSLWFGFFNVMSEATLYPYVQDASGRPQPTFPFPQMFRNVLRDPTSPNSTMVYTAPPAPPTTINTMNGANVILLRSLLAAVNAKDVRDTDDDVSSETVQLVANVKPTGGGNTVETPVMATAYGTERQPFITEIYVNNDTSAQPPNIPDVTQTVPDAPQPTLKMNPYATLMNPNGYVAIELYNPYDVPISLANYTLGILSRTPTNYQAGMHIQPIPDTQPTSPKDIVSATPVFVFPANWSIAPRSFMLLENYDVNAAPGAATYRPFMNYPNQGGFNPPNAHYVPNLHNVLNIPNSELYLLRPRRADGQFVTAASASTVQDLEFIQATVQVIPDNLVPVDSFDFSGMAMAVASPTTLPRYQAWHYVRGNTNWSDTQGATPISPARSSWKQVYPGRWDPTNTHGVPFGTGWDRPPTTQRATTQPTELAGVPAGTHEEGVYTTPDLDQSSTPDPNVPNGWDPTNADWRQQYDPWILSAPGTGPTTQPTGTLPPQTYAYAPITLGSADYSSTAASNVFQGIQLNNTGFNYLNGFAGAMPPGSTHGVNKNFSFTTPPPGASPTEFFPFGGFARTGDVLQVPFIGAYTIKVLINPKLPNDPMSYTILEMNTVTRDGSLADDFIPANYPFETVGRFCPLNYGLAGRFVQPPLPEDPYGWAAHILDCFTAIQSPNDDYLPHADPTADPNSWPIDSTTGNFIPDPRIFAKNWFWDPSAGHFFTTPTFAQPRAPDPIRNSTSASATNLGVEDRASVEGLININTAPWRVLAAVPWKAPDGFFNTPARLAEYNGRVASAIIQYRGQNGPFKSLFDLNKVIVFPPSPTPFAAGTSFPFQNINGNPDNTSAVPPASPDFDASVGDFTPNFTFAAVAGAGGLDGMRNDFKERYQAITRLSNILTTRSDTFTVYIYLQGWRGIGTPSPELVVQRRSAFVVDRSGMINSGSTPVIHNIPTE